MKKSIFVPTVGIIASKMYSEDKVYYDCKIVALNNRTKKATCYWLDDEDETATWECPIEHLEEPINPVANDRFRMLEATSELAFKNRIKAVIVTGQAGLGKSFHTALAAQNANKTEGVDYGIIKGHCTPLFLYKTLFDYNGKTVMFDDCDSVLTDKTSDNILKAVLDTTGSRTVSWASNALEDSDYPTSFQFTGSIIFISNLVPEKFSFALRSRSCLIDVTLTPDEIIERLNTLKYDIAKNIGATNEEADTIINMMSKYRNNIPNMNIRTLTVALLIYNQTQDAQLVRYQLLKNIQKL
jgi:hypothetical protein